MSQITYFFKFGALVLRQSLTTWGLLRMIEALMPCHMRQSQKTEVFSLEKRKLRRPMIAILNNLKGWHGGRGSRHVLWTSTNGRICQAERFQPSVSWPLSNHLGHSTMKWAVAWGNEVPITEEVEEEGCGLLRILRRLSWRVRHLRGPVSMDRNPCAGFHLFQHLTP